MAPRRRILGFNQPINGLMGGKAGSKDPRDFISGNTPGQQWDIEQFAEDRASLYANPPPQYSEVSARTTGAVGVAVQTVTTRITFIPWTLDGSHPVTTVLIPQLLVPRNPRRVAFQMSGASYAVAPAPASDLDVVHYSWGKPSAVGAIPLGNVLAPGTTLKYAEGACPIDEFWVWSLSATGVFYCAFEGIEAPEANQ